MNIFRFQNRSFNTEKLLIIVKSHYKVYIEIYVTVLRYVDPNLVYNVGTCIKSPEKSLSLFKQTLNRSVRLGQ